MASCTFRLGEYHIGVRVNTEELGEWLRAALPTYSVDDDDAPPNYSLRVNPPTPSRAKQPFHFLFDGGLTAVRTRSPRRAVSALLQFLSHHAHQVHDDVLAVEARALVCGQQAVLMPLLAGLETLERPLNRAGWAVLDVPHPHIDMESGELVVRPPSIVVEESALARLSKLAQEPRRPEPLVEPGRYRITRWIFPGPEDAVFSKAEAVAYAVTLMRGGGTSDIRRALSALAELFAAVEPIRIAVFTRDVVLRTLEKLEVSTDA